MKKKIAILCSTDYNSYPVGGMMSFVKDAASEIAIHFEVDFWGVDAGAGVNSFNSGGDNFPVRFFGTAKTGRKVVPNMIRVTWQLWRNRRILLDAEYDAIYVHGIPLNAALPCHYGGPKRINHVHGLNNPFKSLNTSNGFINWLFYRLYEIFRRRVLRDSDLVLLAGDQKGLASFIKLYPTPARMIALPNFCDTEIFGMHPEPINRSELNIGQTDKILLYVGRLSREKDPLLAVNIIAALLSCEERAERIHLVMIGGGALEDAVTEKVRTLGLISEVRILGVQSRERIAQWMRSADLLLLTSHFEGFPVVLAEAAQSGLPIVCPEITGIHDLVISGKTGFVVNSRNPEDFVDPILETLANRVAFGERVHELASQYTPERILGRLCNEIADVLRT